LRAYERKFADFERRARRYQVALEQKPGDPALQQQYERLRQEREGLAREYASLQRSYNQLSASV